MNTYLWDHIPNVSLAVADAQGVQDPSKRAEVLERQYLESSGKKLDSETRARLSNDIDLFGFSHTSLAIAYQSWDLLSQILDNGGDPVQRTSAILRRPNVQFAITNLADDDIIYKMIKGENVGKFSHTDYLNMFMSTLKSRSGTIKGVEGRLEYLMNCVKIFGNIEGKKISTNNLISILELSSGFNQEEFIFVSETIGTKDIIMEAISRGEIKDINPDSSIVVNTLVKKYNNPWLVDLGIAIVKVNRDYDSDDLIALMVPLDYDTALEQDVERSTLLLNPHEDLYRLLSFGKVDGDSIMVPQALKRYKTFIEGTDEEIHGLIASVFLHQHATGVQFLVSQKADVTKTYNALYYDTSGDGTPNRLAYINLQICTFKHSTSNFA